MLYPPGDYAAAVQHIKSLINNKELAHRVAEGGRKEVELWGWGAATRTLRLKQYGRAIRNKLGHKRFGLLALRTGIARLLRWTFLLLAGIMDMLASFFSYVRPASGYAV
jgi:hypothetical protein